MKKSMARKHKIRKQKMDKRCKPNRSDSNRPQLRTQDARYDLSEKINATACGGITLIHQLARDLGLPQAIDTSARVLKQYQPYHESDHVLNIAYNILAGGTRIEHLEARRTDTAYLDALGAHSLPDPTTAGDFCRRFEDSVMVNKLQDAINQARLRAWSSQEASFFDRAVIDADGVICPTTGECKEGMDMSYKGEWSYHALVVSLSNTAEPLYLFNRPGNRPSHEGASVYLDKSVALCRKAGFRAIHLRGDTDFTQTTQLDRWHDEGVTFTFGNDARKNVIDLALDLSSADWQPMVKKPAKPIKTQERAKPTNVKEEIIDRRGYRHMRTFEEEVAELAYQPTACERPYRLIVLRKTILETKGLFEEMTVSLRHFFYLTNREDLTPVEVVQDARDRCDQENLNAHLKNGVHALTMPLDTLHANWAYAVMTSLAWSLKAWVALTLPITPRWREKHQAERRRLLRMEFHTFRQALMTLPAQVLRSGRRLLIRLLNWNEWTPALFRLAFALAQPQRC